MGIGERKHARPLLRGQDKSVPNVYAIQLMLRDRRRAAQRKTSFILFILKPCRWGRRSCELMIAAAIQQLEFLQKRPLVERFGIEKPAKE